MLGQEPPGPRRPRRGEQVPRSLAADAVVAGGELPELVEAVWEIGELVDHGVGPGRLWPSVWRAIDRGEGVGADDPARRPRPAPPGGQPSWLTWTIAEMGWTSDAAARVRAVGGSSMEPEVAQAAPETSTAPTASDGLTAGRIHSGTGGLDPPCRPTPTRQRPRSAQARPPGGRGGFGLISHLRES